MCFCDGLGTARGCGWQKIAALINLGAYYIVGVPSAVLLAFVFKLGGKVSITMLMPYHTIIPNKFCL